MKKILEFGSHMFVDRSVIDTYYEVFYPRQKEIKQIELAMDKSDNRG